jgi:hypothetical protein
MLELENKQTRVIGLAGGGHAAGEFRDVGTLQLRRAKCMFFRGEADELVSMARSSFYSLHRRGFVARSSGRSGEEIDFRRRRNACSGLFKLGLVSKPPTSRPSLLPSREINR